MLQNSQILIHQLNYTLANGQAIFSDLSLSFSHCKTGLVGRNGVGKSTLLKLIIGELLPSSGAIQCEGKFAYVPQNPIIQNDTTVAGLLGYEEKLNALQKITDGHFDEKYFTILNDDWTIEEKLQQQLDSFGLSYLPRDRNLSMLSGGEITRLMLIKAFSSANFLLLDEPTNHLDNVARNQLYDFISKWQGGMIVISHDRTLLNLMEEIVEINKLGVNYYSGNYEHFVEQKKIENSAKELKLHDAKKQLQRSKQSIQFSREKHEQKQSYGRQLRKSGSIDKMGANAKKGRSERSQSKMLIKEERMINEAQTQLDSARKQIEIIDEIHVNLPKTKVPNGKMILEIEDLYFSYPNTSEPIIKNFNFKMQGPERVALIGANGSGKTTLINLILGYLQPTRGKFNLGTNYISYLDQSIKLLMPDASVLNNFMRLNPDAKEHDAYRSLATFLFKNTAALKLVKDLSGGEKLRAMLACVLMSIHPPQLLILDEPTNHLDIQSIESIESALKNYQGAMIVISHDQEFIKNMDITKIINTPLQK